MEDTHTSSQLSESKTKKSRDRGANFTAIEISTLTSEYRKVKSGLDNPKIPLVSKQKLWEGIAYQVSLVGNSKRTVQNVKDKWNNMMRNSKNANIAYKKSMSQTGGGPPVSEPSDMQKEIIDLFCEDPGFNGIEGAVESFIGESSSITTSSCNGSGNVVVSHPENIIVQIIDGAQEKEQGSNTEAETNSDVNVSAPAGSSAPNKVPSKCSTEMTFAGKAKKRRITQDMVLEAQYHFFRAQTILAEKQAVLTDVKTAYYRKSLERIEKEASCNSCENES